MGKSARTVMQLLSRGAESAGTPVCFIQRIRLDHRRCQNREQHQLCHPVAGIYHARLARLIVKVNQPLAAVVGVNDADLVGRCQTLPSLNHAPGK